jgi:thioredoxin 1
MAFQRTHAATEPGRVDVEALRGATVIEFGAPWCGYCIDAQPLIEAALTEHPRVRHLKIEDGRGRPLGRSYRIKLWPTLVFLRDGEELARLVRPASAGDVADALAFVDGKPTD